MCAAFVASKLYAFLCLSCLRFLACANALGRQELCRRGEFFKSFVWNVVVPLLRHTMASAERLDLKDFCGTVPHSDARVCKFGEVKVWFRSKCPSDLWMLLVKGFL